MTLDADLHNLTICGSVPPGKRLRHSDGRLYIDNDNALMFAVRRLRGEGRYRTVCTIRNVLTSVEERLHDMSLARDKTASDLMARTSMILRALHQCTNGIRNLQATYVGDPSTLAALELVLEKALTIKAKADQLAGLMSATTAA